MGQSVPLTARGEKSERRLAACLEALNHFEYGFACIEAMTNDERDLMLKMLSCWSVGGRFGPQVNSAIIGVQKYCCSQCELEDPSWDMPKFVRQDFARLITDHRSRP
jgi:hypothetical protein